MGTQFGKFIAPFLNLMPLNPRQEQYSAAKKYKLPPLLIIGVTVYCIKLIDFRFAGENKCHRIPMWKYK